MRERARATKARHCSPGTGAPVPTTVQLYGIVSLLPLTVQLTGMSAHWPMKAGPRVCSSHLRWVCAGERVGCSPAHC
jgi:hypothetical protein